MAKGKNQHVVKHPDGWAVKKAKVTARRAKLPAHRRRPLIRQRTSPETRSRTPKFMAWTERSVLATATETTRVLPRIKSKE